MNLDGWKVPAVDPALTYGEVHVWRAALDLPAAHLESLERVLCAEELCRADRFRFERDRGRYVAARGTLRILLERYLAVDPASVRFWYGEQGKPALVAQQGGERLCFNLAHSGALALYALALEREVGVDLEQIRAVPQMEQVAERFFSAHEYAALQRVDPGHRLEAFFACWTRKEAYIKARGEGLALPLDSFDVSLSPGVSPRLLGVRPSSARDGEELDRWSLLALDPAPGYAGAVAVGGTIAALACWQVPKPCASYWRESASRHRVKGLVE